MKLNLCEFIAKALELEALAQDNMQAIDDFRDPDDADHRAVAINALRDNLKAIMEKAAALLENTETPEALTLPETVCDQGCDVCEYQP